MPKSAYSGNDAGFNHFYAQHQAASASATTAKTSFLTAYNALRQQHLQLPPLDVSY